MDRISNLPDEIIFHIGSFLSAKEVAFTTVLSKRWHILSSIIHDHLHFDGSKEDIKDFVDRAKTLPSHIRVRKFSLRWNSEDNIESVQYRINSCLREVLKRGQFELDLWINDQEGGYSLPLEVFTCKTLTKLSLGSGFSIEILPPNVFLPSLKTLFLHAIRFYEFGRCAFKTLLDACPVLEELTMRGINWELWKWSRTVSSLSLKRLTITRQGWDEFDDSDFKSISFDIPGLVYLKYFDYVPKEYGNVNLSSLVEAELYLFPEENYMWEECDAKRFRPMNFLHGLKNVETLNLYTIQTAKMFNVFRGMLPVFEKLSSLTVNLSNFCWTPLPILIKKSPNLKTLTMDNSLHYRGLYYCAEDTVCECVLDYSFLVTCPLEVLKITGDYYGSLEELIQMKCMLEKLSCLEHVEVHSRTTGESKLKLLSDLQKLSRASSKCKFVVVS